jgi:hypothetical protein
MTILATIGVLQQLLEVISKPISGFILNQPQDLSGEIITPLGKRGAGLCSPLARVDFYEILTGSRVSLTTFLRFMSYSFL